MPSGKYIDWSKYDAKIRELSTSLNMIKIAEAVGLEYGTVKAYMRRNKIKSFGGVILEPGDSELIGELAISHSVPAREIAEKFGITTNYCYHIIKQQREGLKSANSEGLQ